MDKKLIRKITTYVTCFLLFPLLGTSMAYAQEDIWQTLSKLNWELRYSETYKTEIEFPVFHSDAKALNGKEVVVKGYILPVDTDDGSIVISALPFQSCFFCGGGGIETVMAVYMKKPRRFHMEEATFKGKLELNEGEDGLIYNLMAAEEYHGEF